MALLFQDTQGAHGGKGSLWLLMGGNAFWTSAGYDSGQTSHHHGVALQVSKQADRWRRGGG